MTSSFLKKMSVLRGISFGITTLGFLTTWFAGNDRIVERCGLATAGVGVIASFPCAVRVSRAPEEERGNG